eukprot:1068490-Amphidinium_carterae.1
MGRDGLVRPATAQDIGQKASATCSRKEKDAEAFRPQAAPDGTPDDCGGKRFAPESFGGGAPLPHQAYGAECRLRLA